MKKLTLRKRSLADPVDLSEGGVGEISIQGASAGIF